MTDEELIEMLRAGPEIVYRYVSVDHAAADRIEALVKERDDAEWVEVLRRTYQRAKEAEAKLAKAVAVLRDFSKQKDTGELSDDEYHDADFEDAYNAFIDKSRAVLAELDGKE